MESTISLYLLNASDVSEADIDQLYVLLNPEQQHKCASIAKRKRSEFVLSRTLLIYAIRQTLQKTSLEFDIQERSQLPPLVDIAEQQNIQFSISHSQNMIGIAIGQHMGAIGFDLQAIKQFSDKQLLSGDATEGAKYFCNAKQLADLESCINNKTLFAQNYTKLWAQKEAYLKSLQCGISTALLKETDFIKSSKNQGALSIATLDRNYDKAFVLAIYCNKTYTVKQYPYDLGPLSLITNELPILSKWGFFELN